MHPKVFELMITQWLKDRVSEPFFDSDASYLEGFEYEDEKGHKVKAYGLFDP